MGVPGCNFFGWNETNVEVLKKLWQDGLSASQISKALGPGGPSRNAVIGKVHRLGLSGRAAPSRPAKFKQSSQGGATLRKKALQARAMAGATLLSETRPAPMFEEPNDPTSFAALPEEERPTHYCRWPIGDPLRPGFGLCGRQADLMASGRHDAYCLPHREAERKRAAKPRGNVDSIARFADRYDSRAPARIVRRDSAVREL
jgi:GcrA cell cycle regulator